MEANPDLVRQLEVACIARDLREAKRITFRLVEQVEPDQPTNITKVVMVLRTYAANLHGWSIE